jgi:seryl-tRNA synthetase
MKKYENLLKEELDFYKSSYEANVKSMKIMEDIPVELEEIKNSIEKQQSSIKTLFNFLQQERKDRDQLILTLKDLKDTMIRLKNENASVLSVEKVGEQIQELQESVSFNIGSMKNEMQQSIEFIGKKVAELETKRQMLGQTAPKQFF